MKIIKIMQKIKLKINCLDIYSPLMTGEINN